MKKLLIPIACLMTLAEAPAQVTATPGASQPTATVPRADPPAEMRSSKLATKPGRPKASGSGGTRSGETENLTLQVLAPNYVTWTARDQPAFHWYQSKPTRAPMEFALVTETNAKPLLEMAVENGGAGIRKLDLAHHGVRLSPQVEYQWSVAAVNDPKSRSLDLVASGRVQFIPPSPELQRQLASASPQEKPFLYADAGYWQDALQSLDELIQAAPENRAYVRQRLELFKQAEIEASVIADLSR
jgi:hypothetical protein